MPLLFPPAAHKQPELVERFLVVHGQIVLNQFKAYPNKAIQRAAFVGELRARMEQRKHCKLYMGKVGVGIAVEDAAQGAACGKKAVNACGRPPQSSMALRLAHSLRASACM